MQEVNLFASQISSVFKPHMFIKINEQISKIDNIKKWLFEICPVPLSDFPPSMIFISAILLSSPWPLIPIIKNNFP